MEEVVAVYLNDLFRYLLFMDQNVWLPSQGSSSNIRDFIY